MRIIEERENEFPFPSRSKKRSEESNIDRMRKYYKLILVIVTVISFICLIFYKTQYDKLYNVLQVLEFYGSDPDIKGAAVVSTTSSLVVIPPAWQIINPDVYVYSAFCTRSPDSEGDDCPMITTLAIATTKELNDLQCKIWYEGSGVQAVPGIFSATRLVRGGGGLEEEPDQFLSYLFTCESKYPTKLPYGISILKKDDKTKEDIAYVHVMTYNNEEDERKNEISLCLMPPTNFVDSTYSMAENVLFHVHLGVKNFMIYDRGTTNKFAHILGQVRAQSNFGVQLLPWNIPKKLSEIEILNLIKTDCHFRSHNTYKTFTLLTLNQLLVPKSRLNLPEEFDANIETNLRHLNVNLLKFCAEFPSHTEGLEISATPLELVTYSDELSSGLSVPLVHRNPGDKDSDVVSIPKDFLAVHDYSPCNRFDLDPESKDSVKDAIVPDKFGAKFQENFGRFFPHKDVK